MTDLIKLDKVIELASISSATIYRQMNLGNFPKPINVSTRSVRWRLSDIEAWKTNPEMWGKPDADNHPTP